MPSVRTLLLEHRRSRRTAARTWEALKQFVRAVPAHLREPAQDLSRLAMCMLGFEQAALAGLEREYENWWACKDCNGYPDDYMVFHSTWRAAGMAPKGGFLCLSCLERRLGRPLTSHDFPRTREELRANCRSAGTVRDKEFANRLFWRAYELGRQESEDGQCERTSTRVGSPTT